VGGHEAAAERVSHSEQELQQFAGLFRALLGQVRTFLLEDGYELHKCVIAFSVLMPDGEPAHGTEGWGYCSNQDAADAILTAVGQLVLTAEAPS
jgi:hypothetical protein